MFDVAVIGTGAAGVSAVLTLASMDKSIIWFGKKSLSEKIRKAEKIRNYAGMPEVSGKEMAEVFFRQTQGMGVDITEKTVTGVYDMGEYYGILCDQEIFEAKSVIFATGVEGVKPIEGELEFLGRGVSHCATCDGALYKNKKIGVVCTSKEHEDEIEYLAGIAESVVLVPLYADADISASNVETVIKMPKRVDGDKRAEALVFEDTRIALDGIFFLRSSVAPNAILRGLETENGHISVDRMCRTNLEGCFAAGDCTGRPYQYAKAVGEGNVAAHSAIKYLSQKSK